MNYPLRMSEATWHEFAAFVEDHGTILLPIGSLEQHGPHSPNGSDEMSTRLIAEKVAERTGAMVAPSISYGCRSVPRTGGGNNFPGTTSIKGRTLALLVSDILCEFARNGVQNIVLLDTHFENSWFVTDGIEQAIRKIPTQGYTQPRILKIRYFELLDEEILDRVFTEGFFGWELEHAGIMTTSLHLYLTPDLVDMAQAPSHGPVHFPPYDVFPYNDRPGTDTGCLSSPGIASAEKGELIFTAVTNKLCKILETET